MSQPQVILSDMTIAQPASAVSMTPAADKWLVLPYEGPEICGRMIWSPSRSMPPDVTIPLPALGRCRIYLGIYSSGTVPYWFNLYMGKGRWDPSLWHRLQVRLSDEDYDQVVKPVAYPDEPRFTHICERYWKVAELHGQALVLRGQRKEVFQDAMSFLAFIRLVPVAPGEAVEAAPTHARRASWSYFDGTQFAHGAEDEQDIRNFLLPRRDEGCRLVFWNTSREDTCYYPTKVGNVLPDTGVPGNYPFYCGRDLQRMLARGLDPLRIVCEVAHGAGMRLFGSMRRMTYRMPPFVYPLHPNALMAKRRDLWCLSANGSPLPHLSLAQPEVRQRMLAIQGEQLREYDVDGLHLFFCRGVPFVGYEKPFMEAFAQAHPGVDAPSLPLDDPRPWDVRCRLVTTYLRELRQLLDQVSAERRRPLQVALHVFHCVRICRYYGLDIATITRERLVDILIPAPSPFLPRAMADWPEVRDTIVDTGQVRTTGIMACARPEHVEEFERLAAATGVEVYGSEATRQPYSPDAATGHRLVRVTSMDGISLDGVEGVPTCG